MRYLQLFVAAMLVVSLSCSEDSNPSKVASGLSGVNVSVKLGTGAEEQLPSRLVISVVAEEEPEVNDTISIDSRNEITHNVINIAPYKEWDITAFTLDENDSVVHYGTNSFRSAPNRTHDVFMELLTKFFRMQALIAHAGEGMTRAELTIDNEHTFESQVEFTGGTNDTVKVTADYIPLKNEYQIRTRIFGMHEGSEVVMYEGETEVTLPWYDDRLVMFSMNSQPPYYSDVPLSVILLPSSGNTQAGRIGQPLLFSENGHYYDVITFEGTISWEEARDRAESLTYNGLQGHLATITSAQENEFIWRYLAAQSGVSSLHIGAFQAPRTDDPAANWQWITEEEWNYTNWSSGEPNDFKEVDEIHLMLWVYSGRWNDQAASLRGFVVEYE
ncbi:MAG: hypothetical protein ACOC36_00870 [Fibrobacterota bacterium]